MTRSRQHLEESRNSPHPHLVFQFCKRVPEVMRDWRIWLRNALETHVRIWQVFIHSVNNWRERLIGGTEEHSDQMQRLFLLKVLFFSNPGGLLISFSPLMTGKTHDSPLRLPSYLPFVGSISYAAKRIHGVWQVSYPGTTTNPTTCKLLKALKAVHWTPGYHFINMISADFPNASFSATQENLVTYSKSCFSSMLSALTSHVTYLSWSVQFNSTHQTLLSRAAVHQARCEVSVIYWTEAPICTWRLRPIKTTACSNLPPSHRIHCLRSPVTTFLLEAHEITGLYC